MSKCNPNNGRFLSLDNRTQFIQTLQAAFQFLNRLASQIADGSVYAASSAPFFNLHPFVLLDTQLRNEPGLSVDGLAEHLLFKRVVAAMLQNSFKYQPMVLKKELLQGL